jgi:hypothetical protein
MVCGTCRNAGVHGSFVYILSVRPEADPERHKVTPYVGRSRQPFVRLLQQNRHPRWKTGAKAARPAARDWQIEVIFGPIRECGVAKKFQGKVKSRARKLRNRILEGVLTACMGSYGIWARDPSYVRRIWKEHSEKRIQQQLRVQQRVQVKAQSTERMATTRTQDGRVNCKKTKLHK